MNPELNLHHEGIRVWLVEDEPTYRSTFSFLVDHTSGMSCPRTFVDGESLLREIEGCTSESLPDILLMDIHLPGMDGIDCTARLRVLAPRIRIVVLTIYDDDGVIFEAFRAGACGYLLKNAPLDKILAAIREAFAGGMLMPAPVAQKVLTFFQQSRHPQGNYDLSEREREVLIQMVEGCSQKEIASALFISPSTVNGHVQHIYEKLQVHSTGAAVSKAIRERII